MQCEKAILYPQNLVQHPAPRLEKKMVRPIWGAVFEAVLSLIYNGKRP